MDFFLNITTLYSDKLGDFQIKISLCVLGLNKFSRTLLFLKLPMLIFKLLTTRNIKQLTKILLFFYLTVILKMFKIKYIFLYMMLQFMLYIILTNRFQFYFYNQTPYNELISLLEFSKLAQTIASLIELLGPFCLF